MCPLQGPPPLHGTGLCLHKTDMLGSEQKGKSKQAYSESHITPLSLLKEVVVLSASKMPFTEIKNMNKMCLALFMTLLKGKEVMGPKDHI